MAGYNITISATDKTASAFKSVNQHLKESQGPAEKLKQSFADFAKITGIGEIGNKFREMGGQARELSEKVRHVGEGLGIAFGFGSVAGVAAFTRSWAEASVQLGDLSKSTGISVEHIQELGGAARLAGQSGDTMYSSLQGLAKVMQDQAFLRNPLAHGMLQKIGIDAKFMADGTIDVHDSLVKLSDYMQHSGITAQGGRHLLSMLGIDPDLYPMLASITKGIEYQTAAVQRYGVATDQEVARGEAFHESLANTYVAFDRLRNMLGDKFAVVFKPVIDGMNDWLAVASNREWLTTGVESFLRDVKDYIASIPWKTIVGDVRAIVEEFGGWGRVARGLALFMGTVWITSMLAPLATLAIAMSALGLLSPPAIAMLATAGITVAAVKADADKTAADLEAGVYTHDETGYQTLARTSGRYDLGGSSMWDQLKRGLGFGGGNDDKGAAIMRTLTGQGVPPSVAAGMVGNFMAESSLNPDAHNASGHYGLAQWDRNRQRQFLLQTGHPMVGSSAEEQARFAAWELRNSPDAQTLAGGAAMSGFLSPERNAIIYNRDVERSDATPSGIAGRAAGARRIYGIGNVDASDAPVAPVYPSAAPQSVDVRLRISGSLPPGVTVDGTANGAPVKVEQSMPLFGP